MINLTKNEIRARAAKFAAEWAGTKREEAEAQSFQNEFFAIFGINRRKVAIFEHKVKCADDANGYIDLFWKGQLIIEMKSYGKDMDKAYAQARRYADTLPDHEIPHAILICDFEHWDFYDLDKGGQKTSFTLAELPEHIHLFFYLAGYGERVYREEDPVNIKAAELMGVVHDRLKESGYEGHPLEVYLVRLLFCLFADDTGIFNKDDFLFYLQECTAEDGHDLGAQLAQFFQVLNTPEDKRMRGMDERLAAFPYINGGLFAEWLPIPFFNAEMRQALLDCSALDWGKISPAIFGSLFQSVMNPVERRALGAHYTSERNILKLIRPLFMDALRDEFDRLRADRSTRRTGNLQRFHEKLAALNFLDPACGCGNFLVIAYRELRQLELEVLRALETDGQRVLDISELCKVNVGQFYGIEIEEFPAQIAQVAMWLMDHQMNRAVGEHYGQYFARIPLRQSATIRCANALTMDWADLVPPANLSYILGNPPFVGFTYMSKEQKECMDLVFNGIKGVRILDFVTAWYKKAAEYMQGTRIECGFVSTNSICQGEPVAPLWNILYGLGVHINFAHQTFKWTNEAKNNAGVYCIIIGFALFDRAEKYLFTYPTVTSDPDMHAVRQINAYLTDAMDVIVTSRNKALCDVPQMVYGNKPTDGGSLLLNEAEAEEIKQNDPIAAKYIRPLLGAEEFIKGKKRFCLWLKGCIPADVTTSLTLKQRVQAVREFRLSSTKAATRDSACTPTLFQEIRHPESGNYLLVPSVSSERRMYVPMGFLSTHVITSNANLIIPNATLYHFGVLTSSMHMAWMRYVCGRLKSDYRYSKDIVYNNFPWPDTDEGMQGRIAELAQGVLDARALYPGSTLADLYDPLTMPPELVKAHAKLDAAVEKAYGRRFADDADRVAYLFELYGKLVGD